VQLGVDKNATARLKNQTLGCGVTRLQRVAYPTTASIKGSMETAEWPYAQAKNWGYVCRFWR
jgi:hypothetical protein